MGDNIERNIQKLLGEELSTARGYQIAPVPQLGGPIVKAPAGVPTKLDDLNRSVTRAYDLSVTAAAELNIPVAGSVSGGASRRVIILEHAAYADVSEAGGVESQWGYAIRLCVTVNKLDVNAKLSLPFLAASAQLNTIEAQWSLEIAGLAGTAIDSSRQPPTELNVESFVLAKQSIEKIMTAVRDAGTTFTAVRLATRTPAQVEKDKLKAGVAAAIALDYLIDERSEQWVQQRMNKWADPNLISQVLDVYAQLGANVGNAPPPKNATLIAQDIMGRVDVRTP